MILFWRGPVRSSIHTEIAIALALRNRGHDVKFIICDAVMSGCIQGGGVGVGRPRCSKCVASGKNILNKHKLPYIGMGELISNKRRRKFRHICGNLPRQELETTTFHKVPIGLFAKLSLMRHLKSTNISGQHKLFREFLYSAFICAEAARVFGHRNHIDYLVLQRHTEYVGWAPAYNTFINKGIPAITWGGSIDNEERITLRHTKGTEWDTLYTISDKWWEQRQAIPLTATEDKLLNQVLRKQWKVEGICDYSNVARTEVLQKLSITDDKPIWCLFTHVVWDTGLNPKVMLFDNLGEWLIKTTGVMLKNKNVTWLIKIHPAEALGTNEKARAVINNTHPQNNFIFIPPRSTLTNNDLRLILSGGITMHGSAGLQFPAFGIPIIADGYAAYAHKGFTSDGNSREEYLKLVQTAERIPILTNEQITLARQCAYALYFQKRIPLMMNIRHKGYRALDRSKINLLLPGKDETMDMICDTILKDGEFVINNKLAIERV
jgi:hypothetical protein